MVPGRDLGGLRSEFVKGRRRSPQKVTWFKVSESREQDSLVAVGDKEFGFGGQTVAEEHVDQIVAGECRDTRKTHQVNRNMERRRRK